MLNWYQEDYVDFVKRCEKTLEETKANNSVMTSIWLIQLLAEQQLEIAKYMAMMANVDECG